MDLKELHVLHMHTSRGSHDIRQEHRRQLHHNGDVWALVAQEEGQEEWMDAWRPRHFRDDRLPLDPATLVRPLSAAGAGPASAPGCHALLGAERVVNTHVALRGGCGGGLGPEVHYREDRQGLEEDSSEDRRVAATLEAAEQQGLFMVSFCVSSLFRLCTAVWVFVRLSEFLNLSLIDLHESGYQCVRAPCACWCNMSAPYW